MNEIDMINGTVSDEILDDAALEQVAGGAKRTDVYLSETTSCVATFYVEDQMQNNYCWSNDQCAASNEYKYHYSRYSNCKQGGRHDWKDGTYSFLDCYAFGHRCLKCDITLKDDQERFNS